MTRLTVSVDKAQILNDGWHVLGLFDKDENLFHLEVHNDRDREGQETDAGSHYEVLTGKSIAHYLASRTSGLANQEIVVLEFDQAGRFIKAY